MKKNQSLPQRIDAPVFSYWQALYMAFYSKRLYVDVAKRWRGVCFVYLLFMVGVASIPLTARLMYDYNQFIQDQVIAPLATIPPLQLSNGLISLNAPMPYLVRSKTGDLVAMIDTRAKGHGMKNMDPKLMLLVTRDKFYFRAPNINLFPSLSSTSQPKEPVVKQPQQDASGELVLSKLINSDSVLRYKWILGALIYPLVVSFLFGMFFSLFFVVAMLAQAFSWLILRCKIKFTEALRILIVSSTVQVSILLFFLSINVLFPSLSIICLILCVVYFCYAVLSLKRSSKNIVLS